MKIKNARALVGLTYAVLLSFLVTVITGMWVYAVDTQVVHVRQGTTLARVLTRWRDAASIAHGAGTVLAGVCCVTLVALFVIRGAIGRSAGNAQAALRARAGWRSALLLLLVLGGATWSGMTAPWDDLRRVNAELPLRSELAGNDIILGQPSSPETLHGSTQSRDPRLERDRRLLRGEDPAYTMHISLPLAAGFLLLLIGITTHRLTRRR